MIGWVTDPKHPLVSFHSPHTFANLVSQSLKRQLVIRRRQSTTDGVVGSGRFQRPQQLVNRFSKASIEDMFERLKRDQARVVDSQPCRQMKPIDRSQKRECSDAVVQVVGTPPQRIKFLAACKQLILRCTCHCLLQRSVTSRLVRGCDDLNKRWHILSFDGRGRISFCLLYTS